MRRQQTTRMVIIKTTYVLSSATVSVAITSGCGRNGGYGSSGGDGNSGGGNGNGGDGGKGNAAITLDVSERTVTLRSSETVSAVNVLSISDLSASAAEPDPEIVDIVKWAILELSDISIEFVEIAKASENLCLNGMGKNRCAGVSITTTTLTRLSLREKTRLQTEQRSGQCAPLSNAHTWLVNALL